MAQIVLVHGGWHGGWAWKHVRRQLTGLGHEVFCPTMTGLGERSHLAHAEITPDDHVLDIVNVLKWNELEDAVLVGHSYAGFIITGVASRVPEQVSALVYLDAFVPTESMQSAFAIGLKERAAEVRASAGDDGLVPPVGFKRWSADPRSREWLRKLATPHPVKCFGEGTSLSGRESEVRKRLFVLCDRYDPSPFRSFYELYKSDPDWLVAKLPSLHDAMVDVPDLVVEQILRVC